MITNVQILTEEGSLTAVVEPEKRISAVYQNMRSIPNVITEHYGQWVEILDMSHNKLRDVSPLKEMPNLHTLILDHNLIVSTTVFPKLTSLRVLWLNFNLISDVTLFIPPLSRSCPNLRYLSLMGNMASPIGERSSSDEGQDTYRSSWLKPQLSSPCHLHARLSKTSSCSFRSGFLIWIQRQKHIKNDWIKRFEPPLKGR
ncbi:uncharacterized protein NPIL_312121 [Nephila pilipes]|uniref:Uncharacterized protein n=1 Tax=Nephila pilipes TaxID=299642 RepID=A0A8X6TMR6_NEPPI|nr:uncharacterized protein NPIL_312121 [Nephila pilipes]